LQENKPDRCNFQIVRSMSLESYRIAGACEHFFTVTDVPHRNWEAERFHRSGRPWSDTYQARREADRFL